MNRRQFLGVSAALGTANLASAAPVWDRPQQPARRPKVAAVYTVFYHRSHAHNILENFLRPYLFNGKFIEPAAEIVSFYADQRVRENDMTEAVAKQFKIPVFKTIEGALTLGGKDLAVDAVLSIGEHGDYPTNKLGQTEYPRKRFFDESVAVMRRANRFVPFFNDKHLAYRWDWAREMVDTARKFRMPLMAGSSVPLAQRIPEFALPANARIEEAVAIHGGGFESYDFHALENLQSIVEARRGGETGISHVEFLAGDALFKAAEDRRWSLPLAEAALRAEFGKNMPELRKGPPREKPTEPHGLLLTYRDGLRATILMIGRSSIRWNFACKLAGEDRPRAFRYYVGPWTNRNLFMGLSNAIQHFFTRRESPYPVERTLFVNGILDTAAHSRADRRRLPTPHLDLAYQPRDFRAFREMGASWKVLGDAPETRGIVPLLRERPKE